MKNIRTYEGFFDFFKKKNYYSITIEQILDCLLPITDCDCLKSPLKGDRPGGIFVDRSTIVGKQSDLLDSGHDQFMNDDMFRRNDTGGLEISGNIAFFKLQYCPKSWNDGRHRREGSDWGGISDDEVNSIMKECQETLDGFDCKMTFFIGKGGDEGRTWDTEFSDINKMISKTINKLDPKIVTFSMVNNQRDYSYTRDCVRNITVKIKALGGIEE
jgi:hypothetical protein